MPKPSTQPPRQEFERKFLVIAAKLPKRLPPSADIVQGYLHLDPPYDRVRITDGKNAVLEYKSSRKFESSALAMPIGEARYLLETEAKGWLVEKDRRAIAADFDGLFWELDVYRGVNAPLVVVEIETPTADYRLDVKLFPEWVGPDVTDDPRFKNKNLAARPFGRWPKRERKEIHKLMGH